MVQIVHASTATLVDAEGNNRKLAIVGCVRCKGLVVAIDAMRAMHLNRAEAELLVECCRAGQASGRPTRCRTASP